MTEFFKEFNIDSNLSNEEILNFTAKQRKIWSLRLNAPALEKRQEAERKLKLIDDAENFLTMGEITKDVDQTQTNSAQTKEIARLKRKIDSFLLTKNYEQAIQLIESTKLENPNSFELFELQGNIYHLIEEDNKAFESYKIAFEAGFNLNQNQAMLLLTGALCNFSDIEKYLENLDESQISLVAKGEYYISKRDYSNAFEYAQRAYVMDKSNVDANILTLKAMSGLNISPDKFDAIYKNISKIDDDDRLTKTQLVVLFKQQNHKKCEQICKKIRMNNPNSKLSEFAEDMLRKINKSSRAGETKNKSKKSNEIKTANLDEALAEFDVLIGLNNIKEQLDKLRKKVEYDKQRQEVLGIDKLENDTSYHFVFSGNPGTGKTTVARLFSEVFFHLGILSKGHLIETDRSGLVGQYIGETAQKTTKAINDALGGVLFIDEAYALSSGGESDFGKEAIDVLVKAVEDHRSDLIVILAGYKNDMKILMDMNSGLASRFTKYMDFEDYTEEELLEIAVSIAEKNKYTIDDFGKQAFIQQIRRQMLGAKFGNARAVRNLMNEAFEEKANIDNVESLTVEEMTIITAKDFGVDIKETPEERAEKHLKELQDLIGLESAKEDIESLIALITFQKEEQERIGETVANINMHMVFAGNPGTGKTTVARLYGNLLREIGILKQGQFIEVSRSDLVGRYQGQTAPMVKKACEDAYGGILFVDEAYALHSGDNDSFGQEAVNTLIKEMEDNRDKLVVILAGYTDNMDEFLCANPGFASRITKTIMFEDYSVDELWEIFLMYAKNDLITIEDNCRDNIVHKLEELIKTSGKNFGNARDVRKIFESAKMAMIMRVQKQKITGDDRRKILADDIS